MMFFVLTVYFLYVVTVVGVHVAQSFASPSLAPHAPRAGDPFSSQGDASENARVTSKAAGLPSDGPDESSTRSNETREKATHIAVRLLHGGKGSAKSTSGRFSVTLMPEAVAGSSGTQSPLGQGINTPVTRRNVSAGGAGGASLSSKTVGPAVAPRGDTPNEDEDAMESNSLLSPSVSLVPAGAAAGDDRAGRLLRLRDLWATGIQSGWLVVAAVIEKLLSYLIPPLRPVSRDAMLSAYSPMSPTDQHIVQMVPRQSGGEAAPGPDGGAYSSHDQDLSTSFRAPLAPVPLCRASAVLAFCIAYVAGSAYLIVLFASAIVRLAHLDSSTVGATLVALGSEVGAIHVEIKLFLIFWMFSMVKIALM